MMFDPKVNKAIEEMSDELAEQYPEVGAIIEMLKSDEIDRETAIGRLMDIVAQQGIGSDIARVAEGAFAALKAESNQIMPAPGGPLPPIVYKGGEKNLPMLNPLLEAALHERAQFDGDIPELRTGPKDPSVAPAVPVVTSARDLTVVGQQLEQASNAVQGEIDEASQDWVKERNEVAAKLLAENPGMTEETAITTANQRSWLMSVRPADGVPGYETGQLPATRDVGAPTGSALAALSPEERNASAYKALSTTQGRRSALKVIEELVQIGLKGDGYNFETREMGRAKEVPAYAEWTVNISGSESTQSNFSFVDMAARSLCRQITEQLRASIELADPILEVFPLNTVDVRKVGWGARVVPR
jgi:hypothetical protein